VGAGIALLDCDEIGDTVAVPIGNGKGESLVSLVQGRPGLVDES
jgi:hypothetical protein